MEFGLFSESGYRLNPVTRESYHEDLAEMVAADRFGFHEAWIAEPNHVRPNTVTHADLLIAKLAGLTRQIRLGTGIRQLPLHHPIDLVQEANACDHITGGRYIFGYGGTHLIDPSQGHMRGIDMSDTRAMVYESIELMMRCWTSTGPFDYEGRFWQGRGVSVLPKPLQQPHPPVAAACSGSAETIEVAARNGFIPLLGRGTDLAEEIREMGHTYVQAAEAAGRPPRRGDFRVAHFVYVAETARKAREEVLEGLNYILGRRKRDTAVYLKRWIPPGGTLDDITVDYFMDRGVYWVGDPDTVAGQIRDYYEESGGFGVVLLCTGLPVATPRKRARSLRLFAQEVAPRLRALTPEPSAVGAAAG